MSGTPKVNPKDGQHLVFCCLPTYLPVPFNRQVRRTPELFAQQSKRATPLTINRRFSTERRAEWSGFCRRGGSESNGLKDLGACSI